jgi:Na+/H+-dicarboxylate symporter
MKRPQTLLGALLAGISSGLLLRLWGGGGVLALADALRPLGQLWVQGLQMTLVPLVFAMVASGVASAVAGGTGARLIGGAMLLFVALLTAAVTLGALTTAALLSLWPMPAHALAGLPDLATVAPPPLPSVGDQLLAIVPVNPVAAAAAGQMMPLVVFAIVFGFAATRMPPREGGGIIGLLDEIAKIMLTIVEWVLWFAPAGIFVLALGATQHAGFGMASLLGHYVVLGIVVPLIAITACYVLIAVAGPIGTKRFAQGVLAPQAMAAGTCSSMATLPAMIEAAITRLGISEPVAGTILPLAATSFRFASTAAGMAGIVLAAYAAGEHPSGTQLMLAGAVTVLANMGAAGLPAAAVVYASMAPGFQILGAPLGLIPFYIAAIALPDIFLTVANVTADLTATSLLARSRRPRRSAAGAAVQPAE